MNSIASELYQTSNQARTLLHELSEISDSAEIFCSSSGTASLVLVLNIEIPPFEAPPTFVLKKTNIEEKLFTIDPSLADTYREIGQAYHGTTSDPARAAISMMRQTFDHLSEYFQVGAVSVVKVNFSQLCRLLKHLAIGKGLLDKSKQSLTAHSSLKALANLGMCCQMYRTGFQFL